MNRLMSVILVLTVTVPGFAKTHKDMFEVPCAVLWPAVKDTLRNSGKYGIIGIDNSEMTASYNIGGFLTGKRINSLVLKLKEIAAKCRSRHPTADLLIMIKAT